MTPTATNEAATEKVNKLERSDAAVLQRLGIVTKTISQGRVEMLLEVQPFMTNSHGFCHGGFLFSLADTAFAYALASAGASPVTLQASISFQRPVRTGATVLAVGEVSRVGRSALFATSKLYNEKNALVAEFQGTGVNV